MSYATMPDLYTDDGAMFLSVKLSPRARDRYDQSLWYVWGRDDAGDHRLRDWESIHYLGNDFLFAQFAALEAESYEREQRCSLNNIGDQYGRFIVMLVLTAVLTRGTVR